jgi:hypothetical protein
VCDLREEEREGEGDDAGQLEHVDAKELVYEA